MSHTLNAVLQLGIPMNKGVVGHYYFYATNKDTSYTSLLRAGNMNVTDSIAYFKDSNVRYTVLAYFNAFIVKARQYQR